MKVSTKRQWRDFLAATETSSSANIILCRCRRVAFPGFWKDERIIVLAWYGNTRLETCHL